MAVRFDRVSNNILDAVGDTPLLEIEGVYCKLEFVNPSGSIKARIAKYMIERAEQKGLLKSGDTIVEATSGNTGNALSMVAAVKGYRMLVVMPEGLSSERANWASSLATLHRASLNQNGMWTKTVRCWDRKSSPSCRWASCLTRWYWVSAPAVP